MSFQAYLDNIEAKAGKTPAQFVTMAKKKGLTVAVKQRTGPHRDASGTLRLGGTSTRKTAKRKS